MLSERPRSDSKGEGRETWLLVVVSGFSGFSGFSGSPAGIGWWRWATSRRPGDRFRAPSSRAAPPGPPTLGEGAGAARASRGEGAGLFEFECDDRGPGGARDWGRSARRTCVELGLLRETCEAWSVRAWSA